MSMYKISIVRVERYSQRQDNVHSFVVVSASEQVHDVTEAIKARLVGMTRI